MAATTKSVKDLVNPQKDGFLHQYSFKGIANWKKRWFVLHGEQLYYFKAVNSPKQSGVIALSTYNKISDAGKSKKYSFKLESATPNAPVYYLCADNEEDLTSWRREIICSVKGGPVRLSRKSISFTSLANSVKKICTMYINVAEARNLPARDLISGKSDPYLIADAGGCQARTRTIHKNLSPFWGEDYSLVIGDHFANDPMANIKITVWDEDRYTKDTLLGQVNIPLNSLGDGKVHEQWYPLFPAEAEIYVSGNLHLRIDHNTKSKTLNVRVIEGRNLASKDANGLSDPYVKVYFARNKKKTSIVKKSLNPFFNEEFIFEVPETYYERTDVSNTADDVIHVSCWDWDRLGSNEFMGEVVVRLRELEPHVIHDVWLFALMKADLLMPKGDLSVPVDNNSSRNLLTPSLSVPSIAKPLGEVRVKLKYTEDPALPIFGYQPLLSLIQSPSGPLLSQIVEQVIGPTERGELATALINACESYGTAVPLIIELSRIEIMATVQEETLFRSNSLITKGLDAFMKLVANHYLEHIIGPTIKKVYASKKSCEVDPTREKEEHIGKNFQRLLKLCNTIFAAIVGSAAICPTPLREIFNNLQQTVIARFGPESQSKYSAVSSFLFLRHICPAILNPKLFGLAADHPDQRIARTLTLISKTTQNLANLVTFGQKEPYMLRMNEFIEANIPAMKIFLEQVSTVFASTPRDTSPRLEDQQVRAGAALVRYMERAGPDLQAISNDSLTPQPKKDVINELLVVLAKTKQYRSSSSN